MVPGDTVEILHFSEHSRAEAIVDEKPHNEELTGERSEVGRLGRLLEKQTQALSSAHEALDLRDEFLAIVSHDLRNPLNAIALNTQLLERLVSPSDPRLARIRTAPGASTPAASPRPSRT